MNFTPFKKTVIPLTLMAAVLGIGTVSQAQTINVTVTPNATLIGNSSPGDNPIAVSGEFGGTDNKDGCGFISPSHNVLLNVQVPDNQPVNNMTVTIETNGEPTFVIDGPDGRFCILPDSFSEDGNPKISGLWLGGQYRIHVGDRTNNAGSLQDFTLRISRN